MRQAFIQTLLELARQDARHFLLSADLGYNVLEPFIAEFPERFVNVGVAEQNMLGLATGLVEAGFIPWVYSIATFAALRPYEFIRNGPVLHRLPVRIVGVGGGFDYETCGITHYSLEDVAVMRTQPGLSVFAPADFEQARTVLQTTWDMPGPVYYRLGKDDRQSVPGLQGRFEPGRIQWIEPLTAAPAEAALLVMGAVAQEARQAVALLAAEGIQCALGLVASIRPAPLGDLQEAVSRYPLVLTAEAHYVDGGLGSLVAEVAAESGASARVLRAGVRQMPTGAAGHLPYLYETHGLSASRLAGRIREALALRT